MFMIAPMPSVALKPGSGTRPFPGIEMDIYDEDGNLLKTMKRILIIKNPWPE